jgi:hypothetical protein
MVGRLWSTTEPDLRQLLEFVLRGARKPDVTTFIIDDQGFIGNGYEVCAHSKKAADLQHRKEGPVAGHYQVTQRADPLVLLSMTALPMSLDAR